MRRGGIAGGVAGLAMFACAQALAAHGQAGCLQPFTALALNTPAPGFATSNPATLLPGVLLHESVAILLGMLAARLLASSARVLLPALWLAGGTLSMVMLDQAILAWRAPGGPMMLSALEFAPYLAYGLVLAIVALGRGCIGVWESHGRPAPSHHLAVALHEPSVAVLDRPVLEVIVAAHCFGCERAQDLAAEVRRRFPDLIVRVVDLEQSATARPGVVAVPTYLLGGKILFTGNPTLEVLLRALVKAGLTVEYPSGEQD